MVLLKALLEQHRHLKLHPLKQHLRQQLHLNNCLRDPLLHSPRDLHLQLPNTVRPIYRLMAMLILTLPSQLLATAPTSLPTRHLYTRSSQQIWHA